ncbi:protein croquemort isoform X2 [Cryptotermes secundus]|nr:protein croquemort isoform X2 [Cryptotermes secundus]
MGLTSQSESYTMWEETPIPMFIEVYFFNWTNAAEFQQRPQEVVPEFAELGPYIFSEHHTKVNIVWNDNNTVTFQQVRRWHFDPERSNGTLRDEITNINVIAVTVEYMIRHFNPVVQIIVDTLVKNLEPLFVTKTVGQLMFEGYEDELLNITAALNVSEFQVPMDKFGWFYPRNNSPTYDGVFNMHTGTDNLNLLGIMDAWNYEQYPPYYDGECARITGSTGELFPPLENVDKVALFAPELCSSLDLVKSDDPYSKHGLEAYRFIGDDRALDNGTKYPDNRCYCAKRQIIGTHEISACTEECAPSGVRSISKCRFGAPAYISFPHFYKADPSYLLNIRGLNPKQDLHEFYVAVEPHTGIPLDVKARVQINILLRPYKNSKLFNNVPKVMIPMLWFTQSAELSDNLADLTKLLVSLPAIGWVTFFGLAGIGALLIICGIVITLRRGWDGDDSDKLLANDSSSGTPVVREVERNREEEK